MNDICHFETFDLICDNYNSCLTDAKMYAHRKRKAKEK